MTFLNINTAAFTYQIFKEEIFFFKKINILFSSSSIWKKKLIDCYVKISIVCFYVRRMVFISVAWFNDSLVIAFS